MGSAAEGEAVSDGIDSKVTDEEVDMDTSGLDELVSAIVPEDEAT